MKTLCFFLSVTFAIGAVSATAATVPVFEDDLNDYWGGPLAGQGGWELWPSSKFGPEIHMGVEGSDGTPVVGPAGAGASGVIAAQVIVDDGFQLLNDDLVTIEFDILRVGSAANIPSFGIGSPNVTPASIGSRISGALEVRGENFGTQYPVLNSDGTAFIRNEGELYRIRGVWDLAANSGMGSGTIYYKNLTLEETEFTQLFFTDGFGGVQESVSLELMTDPIHWSRAWMRNGTETQLTYFDNLFVSVDREGTGGGFDQWRTEHFTESELADPNISGPSAAPAGDGVSNLLKYAFGLLPKEPADPSLLPQSHIEADHLHLTYSQLKAAMDVDLTVEVSSDLLTWESGTAAVETVNVEDLGDTERIVVRLLPAVSESTRLFGRLSGQLTE